MRLDLSPAPGSSSRLASYRSQTGLELRLTWRNGEQVLLNIVIPVALLLFLGGTSLVDLGPGDRVSLALAGVLTVAVIAGAFTGPAIGVGFDRRSGALRLLGTTPLGRPVLLAAKATAVGATLLVQVVLLLLVAVALGWHPQLRAVGTVLLLVLGTAAFAALGFALAGVLRAEATLAAANGIFLVLLLGGGSAIPTDRLPSGVARIVELLPSGALGNGLRATLAGGSGSVATSCLVLLAWLVLGVVVSAATFRWD